MTAVSFEMLNPVQQEAVQGAYGTDRSAEGLKSLECAGCVVYIGETAAGKNTYFWHYGASDGYVALPTNGEMAQLDYESGHIFVLDREFTTEGEEIAPPPFMILLHFDIRKWHQLYKEQVEGRGGFATAEQEENFLFCCQCNAGSIPPERVATRLKLDVGKPVIWIGHAWLNSGELTGELKEAALAITLELPTGDRFEVY